MAGLCMLTDSAVAYAGYLQPFKVLPNGGLPDARAIA